MELKQNGTQLKTNEMDKKTPKQNTKENKKDIKRKSNNLLCIVCSELLNISLFSYVHPLKDFQY